MDLLIGVRLYSVKELNDCFIVSPELHVTFSFREELYLKRK